ncbi:hypothetical protein L209DRAFT_746220 [Thermothelomyces heterothallicus CBS 203.75]
MIYLAVVVPFLEALELEYIGGEGKTEFLFARVVTKPKDTDMVTPREMTAAVKIALLKGLPNAMTVAVWRHVAIAFGRKYLGGELVEELTTALEQDDHKDDTIDLMAGHSSRVADMHYAREIEGGTKFDKFFSLGVRWH